MRRRAVVLGEGPRHRASKVEDSRTDLTVSRDRSTLCARVLLLLQAPRVGIDVVGNSSRQLTASGRTSEVGPIARSLPEKTIRSSGPNARHTAQWTE
jgi:hypothetical protein